MKQILYLTLIAFILSSCSPIFYYSTLNSTNEYVEKVDNGDFLIETDSLWIAHCFKGENAPVQVTIFNKSDKPLYVDWKRSAIIIDNIAYSYAGGYMSIKGNTWSDSFGDDTFSSSYGGFSGVLEMSDNTTFVPPQTMISEIPFLIDPSLKNLNKDLYRNISIVDKDNVTYSAKRVDFSDSESPLRFKSYLTIYSEPDKPMAYEQDFYLSSIVKTNLKPKNLAGDMADRGDIFYLYQPANNTALYTTLGIVAVGGLVVVGAMYGDGDVNYYDGY